MKEVSTEKAEFSINSDVSQDKQVRSTREAETMFRSIFESASDVMVFLDRSGKIIDVNKKAVEVFGGSKSELIGKHLAKVTAKIVSPKDVPRVVAAFLNGIAKGRQNLYVVIKNKRGQEISLECSNSQIKVDDKIVGLLVIGRDITERKNTEKILSQSEEQYRNLVELAPDGIITVDLKGVVTSINSAFERLTGFSKDEIVGKHFTRLPTLRMKDMPKYLKLFSSFSRGKTFSPMKFLYRRKDGAVCWVEAHLGFVKDNGKIVGAQVILRDITEHKHAEEALRESEEKYRSLFENAKDVILTSDLRGNITSINKAVKEYGFEENEIVGKNMIKFVSKKYWPTVLKNVTSVAQGKSVKGEIEIITSKGKLIVEYSSNPITRGNNIIGVQTILRDVTERKELEEKLRQYSERLEELVRKRTDELLESEKRYSVLVEEASDGVAILQDGKIVFTNKKTPGILGYSREEAIGLPFEKFVSQKYKQLTEERYKRRLQGEIIPSQYEIELIAKTGNQVPVELSATRIQYQGHPADLIIVRDIRERKQMEEQHLKLEKLATIGELATMVAHDLRNPLTSIRNACFYIKNTCSCNVEANKTRLQMIDIIEQETLFADKIINDLLDLSAKRPLQKNRQDINEIIKTSIAKSNVPKNISIETHFAKETTANVDERQLERVLLNLIRNAVQAMPNGGKLALATKEMNDFVEIVLADTGVGVPEENMNKLFTPLFTTKAKGIGMGLAICKKIVEEHDGTIGFESKTGQGTTFTIKLPRKANVK